MYANATTVKSLCRNRKSNLVADDLTAAAMVVDAEIDARLSIIYYWPLDSDGNAYASTPNLITAIANLLTAGLVESETYAHNEAGGIINPYGAMLTRRGNALLDSLANGNLDIEELERTQVLKGSHDRGTAEGAYAPASGLPSGRRLPSQRRWPNR